MGDIFLIKVVLILEMIFSNINNFQDLKIKVLQFQFCQFEWIK